MSDSKKSQKTELVMSNYINNWNEPELLTPEFEITQG